MTTDKQAWSIYFSIYGDKLNKLTNKYEPSPSQVIVREKLKEAYNWYEIENKYHLQDKIKNKFSSSEASLIITQLLKYNCVNAIKILIK